MQEPTMELRSPPSDRDRRQELGLSLDFLAEEAGVTVRQLRDYESTPPGHSFDAEVARSVAAALTRLEQTRALP
jgi:transcriptional regulator with XRE-family HTH domain